MTARLPLAAVLLLATACKSGPAPDLSDPWLAVEPDLAATYQEELDQARAEQGLPGLAMVIADHDAHTMWVSTSGEAVLDPATAWTPEHRTRIGSISKTFTATLVFQLAEEGTLSLDDPLKRWLPGWWTGVTLAQLLSHSSGIVSYNYVPARHR